MTAPIPIHVGHSPDPDDAFMFHALANGKIDTGRYVFHHVLQDIETLNRRAFAGELELTAVSLHGYAYLTERYALCDCGASMGDGYGPMVVAREAMRPEELQGRTIAVPGTLTSAFLALNLFLQGSPSTSPMEPHSSGEAGTFRYVVAPFDTIPDLVADGKVDAGLIIHEGQLTFRQRGLNLVVDLGRWWTHRTGLPLPLGANAIRKDLGETVLRDVTRLLRQSIAYGLEHRREALEHALQYGRDLDTDQADAFVGMYVNNWTLRFGPRGEEAVSRLLDEAHQARIIPHPVKVEFISGE